MLVPAIRRSFSFADSCNRRRGWQAGRSYSHQAASTGARIEYLLLKVTYHACAESGLLLSGLSVHVRMSRPDTPIPAAEPTEHLAKTSRPRPLFTANNRHHRSTTGVCCLRVAFARQIQATRTPPRRSAALQPCRVIKGVPSRLLPSLATTGQGFTPRGGHARPFRSRDRCYLTVLLTRRLHSSSRDDKVVDDNAEICGTGEPHRSRSLP
jgi:hypothetical protein